jgi:hypothetical protein
MLHKKDDLIFIWQIIGFSSYNSWMKNKDAQRPRSPLIAPAKCSFTGKAKNFAKQTNRSGKKRYATKGWTPARRAAAAARIRAARPWEKSTGPRTAEGKARCAGNALRHGMRSARARTLLALLSEQRRFRKAAVTWARFVRAGFLTMPPDPAPMRDWEKRVIDYLAALPACTLPRPLAGGGVGGGGTETGRNIGSVPDPSPLDPPSRKRAGGGLLERRA